MVPYHQDKRLGDEQIPLPVAGGVRLVDPELPNGDIWRRLAALDRTAADQIAADVRAGGPTTVVSGDCLIAMAALAGAQRAGVHPGIVWFDAHGDVHTLDTTTSGYLGGLSLRLVLGAHPESYWPAPWACSPWPRHGGCWWTPGTSTRRRRRSWRPARCGRSASGSWRRSRCRTAR